MKITQWIQKLLKTEKYTILIITTTSLFIYIKNSMKEAIGL